MSAARGGTSASILQQQHVSHDLAEPSTPRHARHHHPAGSSAVQSLTLDTKLEFSPRDDAVRSSVLRDSYFPDVGGDVETPEEMQKKDPLATQVWKLYSKAKTQLPNAERMENLTWRMMAMNLRRMELERKG
jgi:GATA-binding protein, other eukaryote